MILGWILKRPEGLRFGYWRDKEDQASYWEDHNVWGLATHETLGLAQTPERPVCVSAHEATGKSVDP